MKLAQIRNLVAVAERGSVQSSAEALGVSQTALIRSIRDLEQELGTPLFKRGRKPMTLTPIGEIFVRRVSAAQVELDRARHEIGQRLASPTGLISIGLSAGPHVSILPKILKPFRARFADVRIRIVEGVFPKVERDVREGILDFHVGPIWPHHHTAGLKIVKLLDVPRIVVGRRGHPLADAASLAELAEARWIATSSLELEPLFERHRLPAPIIVMEVETGLGMLSAVAASDALLILSASWLPLIERTDLLTPFRRIGTLDAPSICLVTRTELPLTPAAACLHDLIVQSAGGSLSRL